MLLVKLNALTILTSVVKLGEVGEMKVRFNTCIPHEYLRVSDPKFNSFQVCCGPSTVAGVLSLLQMGIRYYRG